MTRTSASIATSFVPLSVLRSPPNGCPMEHRTDAVHSRTEVGLNETERAPNSSRRQILVSRIGDLQLSSFSAQPASNASEMQPVRSVRRDRKRAWLVTVSGDRLRCNRQSSPSRAKHREPAAGPATGFQTRGRKNPMRRPVRCRSSISRCLQLHQGLPGRQYVVCSNEAHGHGEQEACSNQARGCRRWNIEEPAPGSNDQAKNESDDRSSHNTALPRTRSNRKQNPINGADAKCENAIGWRPLLYVDSLPYLRMELGSNRRTA